MANTIEELEKVDDVDLEELAKQIKDGYTSGRLDNGEGKHIAWELKVTVWTD
jgi:hypothetical protein